MRRAPGPATPPGGAATSQRAPFGDGACPGRGKAGGLEALAIGGAPPNERRACKEGRRRLRRLRRRLGRSGLGAARPGSNLSANCGSHLHPVNMFNSYNVKFYHSKALTSPYPGSHVERGQVPEDKVGWLIEWKDYNPVEYTAMSVLAGPSWADPQINDKGFSPKFNERDGEVERRSLNGLYVVENGRPRNPVGRTGLTGRGLLGRWGPNHAADPVVTRWKRDRSGNKIAHPVTGKNILRVPSTLL
ncbi:ADP-ribose pyrophosphatase, mitochondrial-like isoform X4 [Aquila chrysaetos chrysaetos]|uniref:ADP-ribose pyrophosphatase, mitochondrial-like isoform X4 n=1 Tax=Aquila chrysaetos chrysaetos TaxID=223781 RepID=UPI0011772228|nr:ADP-ribose pyrophosphatase, mitochondrial-like isoform X4 [Aquila chrysaetos chrysaetos]